MLRAVGVKTMDQLIRKTIPANIRLKRRLRLPEPLSEYVYLRRLKEEVAANTVARSYIGMGYYGTVTPSVIRRNILENPGWYTPYTPYQAEISQGRLEALLNFQTAISDLTGMPLANASLLDEATAAAEAMAMLYRYKNKRAKDAPARTFLVSDEVLPQTIAVLQTRGEARDMRVVVMPADKMEFTSDVFGVLFQYPGKSGAIRPDLPVLAQKAREAGVAVAVAADVLALTLLAPPAAWGADVVVGSTQRFGVPLGFGGPHAAYFATREAYKRLIPGRIIGVTKDADGRRALRMALQTREQHIRREKATSNICTAQALLASMAGMYAVWHGAEGLTAIATRIHDMARALDRALTELGYRQTNRYYFDTLAVAVDAPLTRRIKRLAKKHKINFYYGKGVVQVSLDETVQDSDLEDIVAIFAEAGGRSAGIRKPGRGSRIPPKLRRNEPFLQHEVFRRYRTETKMMRYLKSLENKDLSLTHSMISLGSCTMKLNAATELLPITWPELADLHPFAPKAQNLAYQKIIEELGAYLCEITGLDACSFQPNSGAQGEFTGLMLIRAYHRDRGEGHRRVVLIPSSAHGTNPASAVLAGMDVVIVPCDEQGNVDVAALRELAKKHKDDLAAFMITYPSTHGVFESAVKEMCRIIHRYGGLVYLDGANLNAQVGFTHPGTIGADVCHLNLHKTFAIPHGGGGPGVGPVCVNKKLAPFLPGHPIVKTGGAKAIKAVSAAPYGSAGILVISHAYIRMLGTKGLEQATAHAILNANYIRVRLAGKFPILYTGDNGFVAHELIVDLRPFKSVVSAEDVAKRLMDYGFHAPTLSFPVPGTIMIEPTESESKEELDRFCDALLAIREEIDEIARGAYPADDNVLVNAPHTLTMLLDPEWKHPYTRAKAAYPLPWLKSSNKFWPAVRRVDQAGGDRHLVCTCPPAASYADTEASHTS